MSTRDAISSEPADDPAASLQRFALLARVGSILGSSLDYAQTLNEVARITLPALGDLCIVDVFDGGRLAHVATAHINPAKEPLVAELRQRYPPSADSPQPAARVMRTGTAEVLDEVTAGIVASHAIDDEHARLIATIDIRSHLAIPLRARGTTVGILSLGITESDRRYGGHDVALAEELAQSVALAIDNARLYELAQRELAERRRAEAALRLSEERFRALVEQSPLSTQVLAPSGRTLRVNAAFEDLWGISFEQLELYNILRDPQLEERGVAPLLRQAFAGTPVHLPTIRYDPAQTTIGPNRHADPARWVRAFAYPVKNAAGEVQEVVLVHENVTHTRRAEAELRASEERLRLALDAGRMNVWDWDLLSDVVTCSGNARAFWGIDIGRSADFLDVIHPDDLAAVTEAGRAAMAGERPYVVEYRLTKPDGGIRWVQSRGRVERAPDGSAVRLLGVTLDFTDLKQAEEAARLLADAGETLGASLDYHVTLRGVAQAVVPQFADWWVVDLLTPAGALERVSVHHSDPARLATAADLFVKYPPRRSDPFGVWQVIERGQPEFSAEVSPDILETLAQAPEQLTLLRSLECCSYVCVPLTVRGTTIGVLTLAQAESRRRFHESDVSVVAELGRRVAAAVDNATLYQQLREEDRRKDEFLATLAHELRNPLAPITTGLSLLRQSHDAVAADRTLQIMERQLRHLVRLVDDLLDVARIARGRVQLDKDVVSVSAIVASAVEGSRPLLDAAGVQLIVHQPDTALTVEVDRTRMSQVLINLLNNAAKFSERGGEVRLEVSGDARQVVIRVTDTGAGIPPQMLGQIFDMFVQAEPSARNQGGLGIGLTLARQIVDLHGGRIWATSEGAGRGSTFTLQLPGVAPTVPSPGGAAADAPVTSPRRILVVDDNADAADMLAAVLALDGHEVQTAFDGESALALLERFAPDLAFLDIGLPGISGHDLARRLRSTPGHAGMTLVAVTGWGQDRDRLRSHEAGFDHHLTKPIDPKMLRTLVQQTPVRSPDGRGDAS